MRKFSIGNEFRMYKQLYNNLNKNNTIKIYLTHQCNYQCYYCDGVTDYKNKHSKRVYSYTFINIKKLYNYIQQNKQYKNLLLYGGEPTLHPQLINFFKQIRNDFNIFLYTNLSKDIKYYNDLDNCKIIASYHYQNKQFEQKIKNIHNIHCIYIPLDFKNFAQTIKVYDNIKKINNNTFLIELDYNFNNKYVKNLKYDITSLSHANIYLFHNNFNTITSSGNIYDNEYSFINGEDPNDNKQNIIKNINDFT